jgi:transcription initiation factor IIF auxiliary subunit
MHWRKFLLLGLSIFIFPLSGCREYHLYHYEEVRDSILNGEIVIEVVANRHLLEENGKKLAVEGNPYSLLVKYFSFEKFKKIEVDNLVLTGITSGNVISLLKSVSKDARIFSDTNEYFSIVSFSSQLENQKVSYEPYHLKAILLIYEQDGSLRKGYIDYQLKPNYKTERRNDILDGIMGI